MGRPIVRLGGETRLPGGGWRDGASCYDLPRRHTSRPDSRAPRSRPARCIAVDLPHPVPEPRRAGEQDVGKQKRRKRDREGRGVRHDDEQCPDEAVRKTHAYLGISRDKESNFVRRPRRRSVRRPATSWTTDPGRHRDSGVPATRSICSNRRRRSARRSWSRRRPSPPASSLPAASRHNSPRRPRQALSSLPPGPSPQPAHRPCP
jgi:hypothetical protein